MLEKENLFLLNNKIYNLISFIGFGFSLFLFIHILFFSKTFPTFNHIPIKESYHYELVIPLFIISIIINILLFSFNKKYIILNLLVIWANNFFLVLILRLTDSVLGGFKYILLFNLTIVLIVLKNIIIHQNLELKISENTNSILLKARTFYAKSIPLLTLFLSFFSLLRLFNLINFNIKLPVDNSYIASINDHKKEKNLECLPIENTILHDKKLKSLIVVIDGFPSEKSFISLTGKSSKVHNYLKKSSEKYKTQYTSSSSTVYSLPYLLGGIKPNPNCLYPSIGNVRKINLAYSSFYFSQPNSLCKNDPYSINSLYEKFLVEIKKVFQDKPFSNKKFIKDLKSCSLYNDSIVDDTISWAEELAEDENNIQIIHDFYFHAFLEEPEKFPSLDTLYLQRIKTLVKETNNSVKYDYLIIMNDHGPRFPKNKFTKLEEENIFNEIKNKTQIFKNYHEVFFSVFKINKESKSLPNLFHNKKDKFYIVDKYSYPIEIK